jgi:hypothetical protein
MEEVKNGGGIRNEMTGGREGGGKCKHVERCEGGRCCRDDAYVERLNEHSLEDCLGRPRATAIYIVGGWFCHRFNSLWPAERGATFTDSQGSLSGGSP